MHGTTMVFFVGMPILFGFANYLVPLMIGARDMAFPRLNAFGFWIFALRRAAPLLQLLGGDGLYGAGSAPDVGWFAYAPLTEPRLLAAATAPTTGIGDLVSRRRHHRDRASTSSPPSLTMRCPGMTLSRMPLFVWMMLVVSDG